jgi:hypothetical protein
MDETAEKIHHRGDGVSNKFSMLSVTFAISAVINYAPISL